MSIKDWEREAIAELDRLDDELYNCEQLDIVSSDVAECIQYNLFTLEEYLQMKYGSTYEQIMEDMLQLK